MLGSVAGAVAVGVGVGSERVEEGAVSRWSVGVVAVVLGGGGIRLGVVDMEVGVEVDGLGLMAEEALGVEGPSPSSSSESSSQAISSSSFVLLVAPVCGGVVSLRRAGFGFVTGVGLGAGGRTFQQFPPPPLLRFHNHAQEIVPSPELAVFNLLGH